jgi:hypothetical protein
MHVYMEFTVNITTNKLLDSQLSTRELGQGPEKIHHHHHYHCQQITLYPIHPKKKQCHSVLNLDHFSRTASYQAYTLRDIHVPSFVCINSVR